MKSYEEIINNIKELLNHKGRSKKGVDSQQVLIELLGELRQGYNIELSINSLVSLFEGGFNTQQKKKKLKNLIKGLNINYRFKQYQEKEYMKYHTEVKEYGLNKWKEICLKRISKTGVCKEYLANKNKVFKYISFEEVKPFEYESISDRELFGELEPLTFINGKFYNSVGRVVSNKYIDNIR